MNDSSNLLCGCVGLTHGAAVERLAARPGEPFEQFLKETGAGNVCTACMLDLEYFFVETPRPARRDAGIAAAATSRGKSLKQRLYGLIDRLPPKIAFNRSNWMPLILGPGIEQYLWMANRTMLFDQQSDERDYRVGCTIRDATGTVLDRKQLELPVHGEFRVKLTPDNHSENALAIGSIQVDRFARRPGVRGTTRPQTEIMTAQAATVLHFQGPNLGYDRQFSFFHRPDDDRVFFTIVNCSRKPLKAELRFSNEAGQRVATASIGLEGFETHLHEFSPADDSPAIGRLVTLHIKMRGLGKIHVVSATPDFSRLSIDHL